MDNVLYAGNVVNGMFNGCAFSIRLRVKREFIARIVLMKSKYRILLITESEVQDAGSN
jgi:hypothetical protein